jgi:hypothetical protein
MKTGTEMSESDLIPMALAEIASLLHQEHFGTQAQAIESLRDAALSSAPEKQAFFRSEITGNKWYWLGMGTIADICFQDQELNKRFVQAYFDLATACEQAGLSSIYSRDVAEVFGGWIRNKAV